METRGLRPGEGARDQAEEAMGYKERQGETCETVAGAVEGGVPSRGRRGGRRDSGGRVVPRKSRDDEGRPGEALMRPDRWDRRGYQGRAGIPGQAGGRRESVGRMRPWKARRVECRPGEAQSRPCGTR